MSINQLQAPFPYFGGKSAIADLVWQALGQPKHYLEPFFGSGAVLLARPDYNPTEHVESICDKDGLVCNVWRALQADPDNVAKVCDWPVNHADLCARRRVVLAKKDDLLAQLIADDKYYNVELAGYWIWAANCWIGSGLTRPNARPHLSNAGMGVHKIGKRPHLSDTGKGVQEPYNTNLYAWFRQLSERLRHVRVVCGDWTRICGGNWQDNLGDCGIFFDPPYAVTDRGDVYDTDSYDVAHKVREWSVERGQKPNYRIVIAGYEEHEKELLATGWRIERWSAQGGYGNIAKGESRGKDNRHREMLYFSPHCVKPDSQTSIFGDGE